ncbi:hypothetical protein [Roseibium sp.]|uniref:hypothetical protein n=1 Tax=Roseibium sp. TaxID=1936156 RepID=UPI003BAC23F1
MAKIVVETAETKKKVSEALRENDFQRAVEHYRENSVSGPLFGAILNGDAKGADHRLLLQINPSNDEQGSGGFVIGFMELAEAVHDALRYDTQARTLFDGPGRSDDDEDDAGMGFSEAKAEFGNQDPVSFMERKRGETKALADALEAAALKLREDVPKYEAWLRKKKREDD